MEKDCEHLASQFEMQICADPANLCVVRAAVRAALEQTALPEKNIDGVILALDEALANCIRHGYGGPCDKPIALSINRRVDQAGKAVALEFLLRDFGKQVDPATIKSRDLKEIRPGGLGVHIIHSVMDEVEYSCAVGGGMMLRMVKYVPVGVGSDVAAGAENPI